MARWAQFRGRVPARQKEPDLKLENVGENDRVRQSTSVKVVNDNLIIKCAPILSDFVNFFRPKLNTLVPADLGQRGKSNIIAPQGRALIEGFLKSELLKEVVSLASGGLNSLVTGLQSIRTSNQPTLSNFYSTTFNNKTIKNYIERFSSSNKINKSMELIKIIIENIVLNKNQKIQTDLQNFLNKSNMVTAPSSAPASPANSQQINIFNQANRVKNLIIGEYGTQRKVKLTYTNTNTNSSKVTEVEKLLNKNTAWDALLSIGLIKVIFKKSSSRRGRLMIMKLQGPNSFDSLLQYITNQKSNGKDTKVIISQRSHDGYPVVTLKTVKKKELEISIFSVNSQGREENINNTNIFHIKKVFENTTPNLKNKIKNKIKRNINATKTSPT